MSAALDVLVVVAARVPTESLLALATGSDAAHAPVWAFEVTGDVISAGEPGGHMSVRKITDNGGFLLAEKDINPNLKKGWVLPHFDGAYLPPVCFVCAPSAPLCLCCRRVMRAQVRFRSSRTAMCNVPQPSQVSSMLSPSMNGLSPRWLVPVARMSPGCSV